MYADNVQKPTARSSRRATTTPSTSTSSRRRWSHPADGHQFDGHALRTAGEVPLRGGASAGAGGPKDDADDA